MISFIIIKKNLSIQRGFTLIEILVVVAIIGILAGIIVANLDTVRRSRDSQRISDLLKIQTALEQYKADNGSYPPNEWSSSVNIQLNCPSGVGLGNSDCSIIYLAKFPVDPHNSLDDFYITAWGWPAQYYYTRLSDNAYVLKACLEVPKEGDPNIQGPFPPNDGGMDPAYCKSDRMFKLTNP